MDGLACLRARRCAFQAAARHWKLHFGKLSAGIVDFCAPRQKLIIELDGGQHLEQEAYDQERTEYLQSKGYRVLRFWNNDVIKDLDRVMQVILEALNKSE